MQLIITIPAGWPDSVHADLTTAIRDADILTPASGRNLIFIREPQAAARAMIRELGEKIDAKVCTITASSPPKVFIRSSTSRRFILTLSLLGARYDYCVRRRGSDSRGCNPPETGLDLLCPLFSFDG